MKINKDQKTIQETLDGGLNDWAKDTAIKNVAKIREENPEIYEKALNLQRVLGIGGLWKGTHLALSVICLDLLDVQRSARSEEKIGGRKNG